jgi:CheY-like chemotaxis protein
VLQPQLLSEIWHTADWVELLAVPVWSVLVAFLTLLLLWVFRKPFGKLAGDLGITRLSFLGIDLEFLQEKAVEAYMNRENVGLPSTDEIRRVVSMAARLEPLVRKRRILWVDNNPGGNEAETTFFQTLGIVVVPAISTDDARRIAAKAGRFDLVISDWAREGHDDGPILLKELRSDGVQTPVLFYAGEVSPARYARAGDLGAVGLTILPDELFKLALVELATAP